MKEMKGKAGFTVASHASQARKSERIKETLHLIITPGHTQGSALRHVPSCSGPTPDKHPYVGPRPERAALLLIHNAPLVRPSARKSRALDEREKVVEVGVGWGCRVIREAMLISALR